MASTDCNRFGERLLPSVLDYRAKAQPGMIYGSFAISSDLSKKFRDITIRELANAVNDCARWIQAVLVEDDSPKTVAYMGLPDFRYPIFCLASMKCDWVPLLLSSRNSTAQNVSLLRRAECMNMVLAPELLSLGSILASDLPELRILAIPNLEDLLAADEEDFPFENSFEDLCGKPALILHSSGTTNEPKLVRMTHGTLAVTDNDRNVPTPTGRKPQNGAQFDFPGGGRYYSCFPPYHLAGVQAYLILPTFSKSSTVVIGPSSIPPSGHLLAEIIEKHHDPIKCFYAPPSILEQWVDDKRAGQQAKDLEYVLYGGGPLTTSTGTFLSKHTDVCQMYGSLETGQIQLLVPHRKNWSYIEFNPYEEVDMQPYSDGVYELVLHHSEKFQRSRSLHHNFPHQKQWHSGDLFVPHPVEPDLWQFHARTDDLIVLSNGHKINPISIESRLRRFPIVKEALVVGTLRPQLALLVDLKQGIPRDATTLDRLWSAIEHINDDLPGYARIMYSMVTLTVQEKPFVRAPKGTLVRKLSAQQYEIEIKSMYENSELHAKLLSINQGSLQALVDTVHSLIELNVGLHNFSNEDDLFLHGLDSLQAMELVKVLQRSSYSDFPDLASRISMEWMYRFPTVQRLATQLWGETRGYEHIKVPREETMESFTTTWTTSLPTKLQASHGRKKAGLQVVLTGSTGSLGSQILRTLIENPNITTIVCLNRHKKERKRNDGQISHHEDSYGRLFQAKVEVLEVDFRKPTFGLSARVYTVLADDSDYVIHAAWTVDFNMSLHYFASDHFQTIKGLVDLCLRNGRGTELVFISSTSYGLELAIDRNSEIVSEELLPNAEGVQATGYGKAKQIAEQILGAANVQSGLQVKILRIGQIAGPDNSAQLGSRRWPEDEWFPNLVRTARKIKMIPTLPLSIDWLPVNQVAIIVCEIVTGGFHDQSDSHQGLQVFNIVNPWTTEWSSVREVLEKLLPSAKVVSLEDWIQKLESARKQDLVDLADIPATRLLDFYQRLKRYNTADRSGDVKVSIDNSWDASSTIRVTSPITGDMILQWCSAWIEQ